jgi:hypothetical protein
VFRLFGNHEQPAPNNVHKFEFSSQFSYIFFGATACTSISFAMCSRLIRMPNEEFFSYFHPSLSTNENVKKAASEILNGGLQTGIDLNRSISTGFFDARTVKSTTRVTDGIAQLATNFGGTKDLARLKSNTVTFLAEIKQDHEMQTLSEFRRELLENLQNNLTEDDLAYVAVSNGHTISFFTRTDVAGMKYFYIVDSAVNSTFSSSGVMEIHESFKSMGMSLINRWQQGGGIVEVEAFTLKSRLNDEMQQNINPPAM